MTFTFDCMMLYMHFCLKCCFSNWIFKENLHLLMGFCVYSREIILYFKLISLLTEHFLFERFINFKCNSKGTYKLKYRYLAMKVFAIYFFPFQILLLSICARHMKEYLTTQFIFIHRPVNPHVHVL